MNNQQKKEALAGWLSRKLPSRGSAHYEPASGEYPEPEVVTVTTYVARGNTTNTQEYGAFDKDLNAMALVEAVLQPNEERGRYYETLRIMAAGTESFWNEFLTATAPAAIRFEAAGIALKLWGTES